ncbi:MAG: aspartate aminotransferase family protein [Phycisphaerae bacterium]|nr:aspartate aminotransferase family protein [Phycisphaerae bacterium]
MDTKQLYDQYMITSMVAGFEPVEVKSASKCTYTATDGKTYLDCFSGIAVTNAGHNHPKVTAAAKKQIDELVHCCTYVYYNPRAGELCKVLADITPGRLQKSFLGNSGAEAIEGAMRIAKQYTKRKEIIALSASFHGRTVGTLSITGNKGRKKGSGPYLSGVAFAPTPYCYRCPFKLDPKSCGLACAHAMKDVIQFQTAGDVSAFIAEPVMGEGGIIVPPADYFKVAVDIVRKDGGVFIADEVQSGFGRTGKLFAIEHFGVEPEIMCMAKGIADGFPLSSFTVVPEVAGAFTPGDHLSTFGGSPISCAAAMANIAAIKDEKMVENSAARGEQIQARLKKFQPTCKLVGDVRGKGLMIGIELVSDAAKTPAADAAKKVRVAAREAGVLVGVGGTYGNVIRLQPPLVITPEEADRACATLETALTAVAKAV